MSMPGTQVTYNGVTLNNVSTRQWREELVYDPSGTDMMYKKYHLEFEGYCGTTDFSGLAGYGPWVNPSAGQGVTATDTMILARKPLLTPRKLLRVTVDGTVLLQCYPCTTLASPDRDVNQGPHPVEVQILQISGGKLYKVMFSIECSKLECSNATLGSTVPKVISHRWSLQEEMDENFFTTKIYRGRMRLSQNVDVDPHTVKYITIPPLETGFARKRVSLLAEPNGLEAAYEIIDRQVAMAAPWPATQISGTHSYMTGDGFNVYAECRLALTGAPNCNKGLLVARAIQCLDSRLNLVHRSFSTDENKQSNGWMFAEGGFAITLHFGPVTSVEIYARIKEQVVVEKGKENHYYFNQIPENLLEPWSLPPFSRTSGLGAKQYNLRTSWKPDYYGYTSGDPSEKARYCQAFAQRCLVTDLCTTGVQSLGEKYREGTARAGTSGSTTKYTEQTGSIPSDYASNPKDVIIRDAAKASIYTYATMEAEYVTHQNKVQLPKAEAEDSTATVTAGAEKTTKKDTSADTCFVATVAQPTCYRVVKCDAERVGAWPEMPAPSETFTDGKLTGTLVHTEVRPHPPVPAGDAQRGIYRVAVTYIYAMNRPPNLNETIRIGAPPTLKYDVDSAEVAFNPKKVFNAKLGP